MPRAALVIGMGNAGKRHAEAWRQAGWHYEVAEEGDDWRMLDGIDAVSICTPDNLHCEMICFALEHGKHVLCEKPLTHRMDELERIEAAVRNADGQTFGTNFPLRHIIGKDAEPLPTLMADAGYEHGRLAAYSRSWRAGQPYSLLCGGGIHLVDLILRHSTGRPVAIGTTSARDKRGGFGVYECGHFMIRGDDAGLFGRVTCQFGYEGRHRVWLTAWDEHGPHVVLDQTDEPYDKLADIRQFIADVGNGNPGNGADAIRANRICIEMSQCTR